MSSKFVNLIVNGNRIVRSLNFGDRGDTWLRFVEDSIHFSTLSPSDPNLWIVKSETSDFPLSNLVTRDEWDKYGQGMPYADGPKLYLELKPGIGG